MKDSDEHRSSIGKMSAENQKLHTAIRNLDKDIADLKSEIKSRDDTISDKEKRITDLKRNAIELEKHRYKLIYWCDLSKGRHVLTLSNFVYLIKI